LSRGNRSGYVGIKPNGLRWSAWVRLDKVGVYDSQIQAVVARDLRAIEMDGPLAVTNYPASAYGVKRGG